MEAWKWAPEERGIVEDSLEEVRARMERQKEVGRKKVGHSAERGQQK